MQSKAAGIRDLIKDNDYITPTGISGWNARVTSHAITFTCDNSM